MNNIILGSLVTILLTILLNIIIDYYILKEHNDLIEFIKNIHKNKKIRNTYIVSVLIQTTIFILMGLSPIFYINYFVSLIFYRIAIIDYETKYVDNKLLLMLLLVSIVSLAVNNNLHMLEGIMTGIASYLVLAIFSKITREAFGMGDAKVLGLLGVIYGFMGLMSILFISSIVVFFVSLYLLIKSKENKNKELPFTPYIYIGIVYMIVTSNL